MTFALLARFISSLYSSSRSTPKTSISLPDVSQCLLRRSFIAASTASTTSIQSQSIFGRHGLKFSWNAGASVPTSKDLTLWHFIRHNFTFELITAWSGKEDYLKTWIYKGKIGIWSAEVLHFLYTLWQNWGFCPKTYFCKQTAEIVNGRIFGSKVEVCHSVPSLSP